MPNPTDTARALVERFEMYLTSAIYLPSISNKRDVEAARAALLAYVAGVDDAWGWVMTDETERAALIAELDATGCTMNICGTNGRSLPLAALRELVTFAKQLAARAATTGEG